MNAAFTIVAKNYIGLAQVLEKSFTQNSNADFYIFVADELEDEKLKSSLSENILESKSILSFSEPLWNELSFKYSLIEFCTAIKPSCFKYLFSKQYEKIIYFDPDIYIYNSTEHIYNQLNQSSIIVTPHINEMKVDIEGEYPDYLFLYNGTFNLGFLALQNNTTVNNLLKWWQNRLIKYCFFDNEQGTATDQKWINLLPAFLNSNEFVISRDLGMNMAPWNFYERKIIEQNDTFHVSSRNYQSNITPLTFIHFSGFNYTSLSENIIDQKASDYQKYDDIKKVINIYAKALLDSDFNKYIAQKYTYSTFTNGKLITHLQRRIFRNLIETGHEISNPFDENAEYYKSLHKKKLIDYSIVSTDKQTNKTVKNFDNKLKFVNKIFKLLQFTMGIRIYSILIRFLRRYFKEENQTFLIDSNNNTFK